jgi:lysozyme
MREVNQAARALIQKYEGLRLDAYADPIGIKTIGYGHVITPKDNIGDTITQEQADNLFEGDLADASRNVERLVNVEITDNAFGALTSFIFNLGADCLRRSTLLRLLNGGDIQGAADQFGVWIYAGHEVQPGLIARRDAERDLFLTTNKEKCI